MDLFKREGSESLGDTTRVRLRGKTRGVRQATACPKLFDMAMFSDAVTGWYRDEFVREHLPAVRH